MQRSIQQRFNDHFTGKPLVVASPGRINLIGEHTDYNDGYVLPAAIDKSIKVAVAHSNDEAISLYSTQYDAHFSTNLTALQQCNYDWANYIIGVTDQLLKKGCAIQGFNMVIDGNVPLGAGLSSSAALECAVAFALNELFQLQLSRLEMVKAAQSAEHEFAGVNCGIMDMFASMFGKAESAIRLDCRSLEYEYIPLRLPGYQLLLFNSNVKHNLAATAYNERREQCEKGVSIVAEHVAAVKALRDVTPAMLTAYVLPVDELIYRRCNYVVQENLRLLQAVECLKRGDMSQLGKLMLSTHYGLSNAYEVSCKEMDTLVGLVENDPAVLGARMMGGGFGGCTLNLVKDGQIERVVNQVSEQYRVHTGMNCTHYLVGIADGTNLIDS